MDGDTHARGFADKNETNRHSSQNQQVEVAISEQATSLVQPTTAEEKRICSETRTNVNTGTWVGLATIVLLNHIEPGLSGSISSLVWRSYVDVGTD
ncbi:hypothetical protein EVAR_65060_1 [Eumeta japonica]|uniref:Uncharacterized protein n=1 Tax=Eumeta variegata TaxID=151549 RepID=A0A4C2A029_EUMVA|nr:hypothetical protein EVAR_65060_1 [Eumeta japonica]